ncbi:ABC transporter permease [uncultured Microbacterium sp.]|uniref:ABC transporter permease n=1 Tax=uncultured Microbacterium sp. TaxID=191216 RepID=UPI00261EEC91|nr:ABC transporter permease [uncultured Microbacterium sp.]
MTDTMTALTVPVQPRRGRSRRNGPLAYIRGVLRSKSGLASVIGIALLIVLAVGADVFAPFDPDKQNVSLSFAPPSWLGGAEGHILGTDQLGRDTFSRVIHGLRLSLIIGIGAATISAFLGLALGILAGYFENSVGIVLMRLADIQFAIPFAAVALALAAVMGPGAAGLIILLGLWGWTGHARTISSTVSQVKRLDYVVASRTMGASTWSILVRHIAPAVLGPVIILWSTSCGVLVLAESGLSLLGLGVQSPEFSIGTILSEAQVNLRLAPWAVIAPGLVLVVLILSFSTLGDAMRDNLGGKSKTPVRNPELV